MVKNKTANIIPFAISILRSIPSFNAVLATENLNNLSRVQKDYVLRYVDAINSNDLEALKKLLHANYIACINPTNQDFYEQLFHKTLKRNIPTDYRATIEPLSIEAQIKETEGAKTLGLPYPI